MRKYYDAMATLESREQPLPEDKKLEAKGHGWEEYNKLPVETKDKLFSFLEPYIFLDGEGRDVVFDADAMMAMHKYATSFSTDPTALQQTVESLKQERDEYRKALREIVIIEKETALGNKGVGSASYLIAQTALNKYPQ